MKILIIIKSNIPSPLKINKFKGNQCKNNNKNSSYHKMRSKET